jgi:hypothetical protein
MTEEREDRFCWTDEDEVFFHKPDKPKGKMKINLDPDHELFKKLEDDRSLWWENLKADPDLYIDIRKDN